MHDNQYGITEPIECHKIAPLHTLDAIFTPLVAFDSQANRMGTGGGYYDRTLASLSKIATALSNIIGIALIVGMSKIPIASWDIPLHSIVTPPESSVVNLNRFSTLGSHF